MTTYPLGGSLLDWEREQKKFAAVQKAMQQAAMNQQLNQWVLSTTSTTTTDALNAAFGPASQAQAPALTAKKPDSEKDWLRKRVKEIMWKAN